MKFFIPKSGDTVRVRLHAGEVVDAKYSSPGKFLGFKEHFVIYKGEILVAREMEPLFNGECRFVAPPCDLVPS